MSEIAADIASRITDHLDKIQEANFLLWVVAFVVSVGSLIGAFLSLQNRALNALKKNQIDEKIAMMWGYAKEIPCWPNSKLGYSLSKLLKDMDGIKQIGDVLTKSQVAELNQSIDAILLEMRTCGFGSLTPVLAEKRQSILRERINRKKRPWHVKRYNYED